MHTLIAADPAGLAGLGRIAWRMSRTDGGEVAPPQRLIKD